MSEGKLDLPTDKELHRRFIEVRDQVGQLYATLLVDEIRSQGRMTATQVKTRMELAAAEGTLRGIIEGNAEAERLLSNSAPDSANFER